MDISKWTQAMKRKFANALSWLLYGPIDERDLAKAKREGRVKYIGNKRGAIWYEGTVSRRWFQGGKLWYEIDVNTVGGVPSPMAKRGD